MVGIDNAELHGKEAISSCLNEREIPEFKTDVVFLNKILVNGDINNIDSVAIALLPIEFAILGMDALTSGLGVSGVLREGEALDSICSVLVDASWKLGDVTHNPSYRLACHGVSHGT